MLPGKKPDEVNPQDPEGEQNPSSSDDSQVAEAQSQSVDITAVLKRVVNLENRFRGVQQGTDKQIKHTVTNSVERILQLAGEGKDAATIKRELWIDQQMQGADSTDTDTVSDKDGDQVSSPDVSQVVDQALQLPGDDPRVTELKLKYGNDPVKYLQEGLRLKVELGAQDDDATPGEQPLPQGGKATPKGDNPIQNIDDPKTLYKIAAQEMAKKLPGRGASR